MEKGNVNPYRKDKAGKGPIHICAERQDLDTFENLCKLGFDPMMPDADGNTFLHLLCQGSFKKREYDFLKYAVPKYSLRLARNNQNQTPISILQRFSGMETTLRGEPNYKRKAWEWFEMKMSQNPSLIDSADELTPVQKLTDLTSVKAYL
jgi:hypothetical protein